MQKDKHNIYSKEELLKLIKEGKNAPADMDEFDREALDGLKLLDNPGLLNELDAEIDSIVAKERNRKPIYYFSAAASLLFIVGLVFFFKNEFGTSVAENEKHIASTENLKTLQEPNQPNISSVQPETQTTYEAKEPEEADKKIRPTKNQEHNVLLSQANTTSVPAEEKIQDTQQEGKDADKQVEQFETKKADDYEQSKTNAPKAEQEQQQDLVVNKEAKGTANNNAANNGLANEDQAKVQQATTGSTNQPAQLAFSKVSPAANNSLQDKKDEGTTAQKNKSVVSSYAGAPNKKTTESGDREPSFVGGDTAFATYVKQNLKIADPTKSGIIVVEFLITKTGKAENIKIIKPINGCDACSKDVIDLIKSVKNWAPAVIDGNNSSEIKKISIQYN